MRPDVILYSFRRSLEVKQNKTKTSLDLVQEGMNVEGLNCEG